MPRILILRIGAALVILAGLSLSSWQFSRAEQKRQLEADAKAGLSAAAITLTAAPTTPLPTLRRATARGTYLTDKTILLDNRLHNRSHGYHIITPLILADGAAIAINRGWLPQPPDKPRNPPPAAPIPPSGEVIVSGYLVEDEVDALLLSGQNYDDKKIVWQRLILKDYAKVANINNLLDKVLIVDSHGQGLKPPQPPQIDYRSARSVGYAFQWLGLSIVAAVFYVILARREKRNKRKGGRGENNA